jgi:cytochrome d ubiquinol oxidase subunit II
VTAAQALAVVLWLAVSCYALLGGADFGAGFWDLSAGRSARGDRMRARIEHSIGPVWEANHVWLIFALVVLWTGFPSAFASIASTMYVPLTAVAVGVILRGSAFAFRKAVQEPAYRRALGWVFAAASVLTPFFLGTVAGGIASGRVPPGASPGSVVGSWANPTSWLGGTMAVGTCAWLAAVYLTADATRAGEDDLAEAFRARALVTGVALGALALSGIAVLHADAPVLFGGLTGRGLGCIAVSAAAGLASLWLLWRRRYVLARLPAALAVVAVVWGWGVAQYPRLLVGGPSLQAAAAPASTLHAMLWASLVGALVVVPSLAWLFVLFGRQGPGQAP